MANVERVSRLILTTTVFVFLLSLAKGALLWITRSPRNDQRRACIGKDDPAAGRLRAAGPSSERRCL